MYGKNKSLSALNVGAIFLFFAVTVKFCRIKIIKASLEVIIMLNTFLR